MKDHRAADGQAFWRRFSIVAFISSLGLLLFAQFLLWDINAWSHEFLGDEVEWRNEVTVMRVERQHATALAPSLDPSSNPVVDDESKLVSENFKATIKQDNDAVAPAPKAGKEQSDVSDQYLRGSPASTEETIPKSVGDEAIGGTYDGRRMVLFPQVTLAQSPPVIQRLDSSQNFWPLQTSLRKKHGWASPKPASDTGQQVVSMWLTRGVVPPNFEEGRQLLNSIDEDVGPRTEAPNGTYRVRSGCIGGPKSLQLECRRNLSRVYFQTDAFLSWLRDSNSSIF